MLPTPSDPVAMLVFFLLVFTAVGVLFLFTHLVMGSFIRPRLPDAEKLTIYECGEPTVGSAWIQFDLRFYVVALLFVIFDVEVAFFFPWATVFGTANQLAHLPARTPEPKLLTVEERQRLLEDLDRQRKEIENPPASMPDAKGQKPPKLSAEDKKKLESERKKLLEQTEERRKAIEKQVGLTAAEKEKRLEEFYAKHPEELRRLTLSKQMLPSGLSTATTDRMRLTSFNAETKKSEVVPIEPEEAATWAFIAFWDIIVFFAVLMVGFAYVWRRGDIDWVRAYAHHQEPPLEPEKTVEQQKVLA